MFDIRDHGGIFGGGMKDDVRVGVGKDYFYPNATVRSILEFQSTTGNLAPLMKFIDPFTKDISFGFHANAASPAYYRKFLVNGDAQQERKFTHFGDQRDAYAVTIRRNNKFYTFVPNVMPATSPAVLVSSFALHNNITTTIPLPTRGYFSHDTLYYWENENVLIFGSLDRVIRFDFVDDTYTLLATLPTGSTVFAFDSVGKRWFGKTSTNLIAIAETGAILYNKTLSSGQTGIEKSFFHPQSGMLLRTEYITGTVSGLQRLQLFWTKVRASDGQNVASTMLVSGIDPESTTKTIVQSKCLDKNHVVLNIEPYTLKLRLNSSGDIVDKYGFPSDVSSTPDFRATFLRSYLPNDTDKPADYFFQPASLAEGLAKSIFIEGRTNYSLESFNLVSSSQQGIRFATDALKR